MTAYEFLERFTAPATPTIPLTLVGWKVWDFINYSPEPAKAMTDVTHWIARIPGRFHFDTTRRAYSQYA